MNLKTPFEISSRLLPGVRVGGAADLFPQAVVEWAAQHSDEIGMLRLELKEAGELISDE